MAKYSSIEEARAAKDARIAKEWSDPNSALRTGKVTERNWNQLNPHTEYTTRKESYSVKTPELDAAVGNATQHPANLADLGRRGLLDNYLDSGDLSATAETVTKATDNANILADSLTSLSGEFESLNGRIGTIEGTLATVESRLKAAEEAYKKNPTSDNYLTYRRAVNDFNMFDNQQNRLVGQAKDLHGKYDEIYGEYEMNRNLAQGASEEYRLAATRQTGFDPFVEMTDAEYGKNKDTYTKLLRDVNNQLTQDQQSADLAATEEERAEYNDKIRSLQGKASDYEKRLSQLEQRYSADTYSRVYEGMSDNLKSMLSEVPSLMEQRWATTGDGYVPDEQTAADSNARIWEIRKALADGGYSEEEIDSLIAQEQKRYNAEQTAAMQEKEAANAAQRSGAANLINRAIASLASGGGVVDASIQKLFAGTDAFTGQKELVDYNSFWQNPYHTSVAMASGHNQRIMDNMLEKHEGDVEAAEAAAQRRMWMNDLGVSIIQSGLAMGLTPIPGLGMTAGLLLQSGSAATATMHQYHQMGYSDGQAITMGLAAGAIEYVTERIGMENFLRLVRGGYSGASLWKHILSSVGDQAWTEGKEEGLSNVLNVVADILVTGDDNAITRARAELMAQNPGMTEQEASKQVFLNKLYDLGKDMLGGVLSGGVFGGFGAVTSLAGVASQMDANIEQARAEEEVASRTLSPIRMGKSLTEIANRIIREPALLEEYERLYGPVAGKSNTEKVKEIAKRLATEMLVERDSDIARATVSAIQDEVVAEVQDDVAAAEEAARLESERVAEENRVKQYQEEQQGVIDLLRSGSHAAVNKIVGSETNKQLFAFLTGESLEGMSNNKARGVVSRWIQNNDASQLTAKDPQAQQPVQQETPQMNPLAEAVLGEEGLPADQTEAPTEPPAAAADFKSVRDDARSTLDPKKRNWYYKGYRVWITKRGLNHDYVGFHVTVKTPSGETIRRDWDGRYKAPAFDLAADIIAESITGVSADSVQEQAQAQEPNTPLTDTLLGEQSQPTAQPAAQHSATQQNPTMPDYEPTMRVGKRRTEGEKRSQTNSNSNAAEAEKYGVPEKDRQKVYYEPTTEEERYSMARERMTDPVAAENYLRNAPNWSGVDVATSDLLLEMKAKAAQESGDWTEYNEWEAVDDAHGNKIGNALQAFAIRSRFPGKTLLKAAAKTFRQLELTQEQTDEAMSRVKPFCDRLDSIKEDPAALRQLVLDISKERGTSAFFKRNMEKWLNGKSTEYLKSLAQAQIEALAHDYGPHDAGQMVKSWQTIAQLLKVTTTLRNIGGNGSWGIVDALIGNSIGQALDAAVSGKTGVKAVPVVRRWFNSTYRKAAWDAFNTALLEIALDVDMGSVGNKYDPQTRAYRMSGNPVERFISRASQLLSYALTGVDQAYKGGIEASSQESLEKKNAKALADKKVTKEQLAEVGKDTAEYDTFQNDNALSSGAKTIHDFLNLVGFGGKVQNGTRKGGFGLGDVYMPYAKVPVNLGMKTIEMSPAGIVSGGIDLLKVIKNAKSGKVDPKAQNKAIMKIARGMTGVPLATLFATFAKAGLIIGSDDEDYKVTNLRKMEGRYNAQLNVDGALRWLQGGSAEWQEGDTLWSLDWMQPIAAFMEIGLLFAELSEDEDATKWEYALAYAQGTVKAFLDMPVVSGLLNLTNDMRYAFDSMQAGEFETEGVVGRAAESLATDTLTGLYPGIVANAAKAIDPYQRDIGGDTAGERIGNALIANTPFARNTLDVKLDALGNEMANGKHNVGNSLIYPGAVNEYTPNTVVTLMDEVHKETGRSNFYPDYKSKDKYTVGGEELKLTHEEQRTHTKTVGRVVAELAEAAAQNVYFNNLTWEQKAEVLSDIKAVANEVAKAEFLEGRGMKADTNYERVLELDDPIAYYSAKAWFTEASPSDTTYKQRDYSAIDANIAMYAQLPEDVQELLDDGQTTSRMEELYEAHQQGISAEDWYKVYDKYSKIYDTAGVSASEKTADLDNWIRNSFTDFSSTQRDLMRDQLAYYSQVKGDPAKYDDMVELDIPSEVANPIYKRMNDIEVPDGYSSIPPWARYLTAATAEEVPGEYRDQVMVAYLGGYPEEGETNNALTRYELMRDAGYSAKAFALAYKINATTKGDDKNKDGKADKGTQKANTIAALRSAGYKEHAEILYELMNADKNALANWTW